MSTHWPTVGELVNANWCGRREQAAKHDEHLANCISTWKDSIRLELSEIVRYRSGKQEITNECPRCWGIDIARLAAPTIVAFLKTQLPEANIFFAESDYVYIIVDWNPTAAALQTLNAIA